jgi:hypothetical protein
MPSFRNLIRVVPLALAICAPSLAADPASTAAGNTQRLGEALHWLSAPPHFDSDYNFELTIEVRLLLFWTSKDDVGGGYIKRGEAVDDPSLEVIRLLFGSDPAKAHGINRWGSATEVAKREPGGAVESSAFFGFMKSSQGESAAAMQQELSKEKQQGHHRFEAIISRVDQGSAISTTVPFYSDRDFDFRELEPAERTVLQEIESGQDRESHDLEGASAACGRSNGFLSTVQDLANEALDNTRPPASLCYLFNSKEYTLTLDGTRAIAEKTVGFTLSGTRQKVEHTYHNLKEARFHAFNRATGKKTYFTLLLGTSGSLRGAPVQIDYQPNWWFRIILNLETPDDLARAR